MTTDEFMRDIAPKMRPGWVAMDKNSDWHYFVRKPYIPASGRVSRWVMRRSSPYNIKSLYMFCISRVDDWTQSLRKVGNNGE